MENNVIMPQDRLFSRSILADPKVIKQFFAENLLDNIKSILNLDTIYQEKETYIDDKLRLQATDLIFSANFGGKKGYLYILIEHQSTPTKLMPFRLMKYIFAIMDNHLTKTNSSQLPIVYPILVYSGYKKYNYSTDLFALFLIFLVKISN